MCCGGPELEKSQENNAASITQMKTDARNLHPSFSVLVLTVVIWSSNADARDATGEKAKFKIMPDVRSCHNMHELDEKKRRGPDW